MEDRHISEANARLIASAPELLEVCKVAENELTIWLASNECDCPPEGHICGRQRVEIHRKQLRQAIAKAEGAVSTEPEK